MTLNTLKNYIFYSFFMVILSCATPINQKGAQVRVVNDASLINGCKFKGSVTSSSGWGGFGATGVGYRSAMNELKNHAAEKGGNVLLMSTLSNTMGGTNMSGDSYSCNNE